MRYVVVGLLTAVLDYVLYYVIFQATANYLIAENLKIPVVWTANYLMHRSFTFRTRGGKRIEIGKFFAANVLNIILVNIVLSGLVYVTQDAILAKQISVVTLPIITFALFNKVVFNKQQD